jgi:hypothetical protein
MVPLRLSLVGLSIPFTLLSLIQAQDFSNYPSGSQACLQNAASASGCTVYPNPINQNYCMCNNGGYWVLRVARCLYINDESDTTEVYNTMKYNCASSGTPIGFTLDQFIEAGSSTSTLSSTISTTSTPVSTPASKPTSTPPSEPSSPSTSTHSPASHITGTDPSPVAVHNTGSSTPSKGGLSTADKIAIGIGVPVGFFTIIGAIAACIQCTQ